MPGTPPVTPNLNIPRYADTDPAAFSDQVNAISDTVDAAALIQPGAVYVRSDPPAGTYTPNTSDRPNFVTVQVGMGIQPQEAADTQVYVTVGGRTVGVVQLESTTPFGTGSGELILNAPISFLVPAGETYTIVSSQSSGTAGAQSVVETPL